MVRKDDSHSKVKKAPQRADRDTRVEEGTYIEPGAFIFSLVAGILASILLNYASRR